MLETPPPMPAGESVVCIVVPFRPTPANTSISGVSLAMMASNQPSPSTSDTVPHEELIDALRAPTQNCQMGVDTTEVVVPRRAWARQKKTPGARSMGGAPLEP